METNSQPLVYGKDYWMNSQLSIAKYAGGCTINGREYIVHRPSFDLVDKRLLGAYRRLGRDRVIQLIKEGKTLAEIKKTK